MTIISQTGENVKIRRTARFVLSGTGSVSSYIHMGGKVGVLIEVASGKADSVAQPAFVEVIHDLALQVAAASPRWLLSTEIPADIIETEKDIYRKQVEGKPANVVEKILEGKLKKFYSETCLVDQPFVKEPKMSVTQLLNDAAKKVGDTLVIKRFVRYQLGA